MEMQIGVAVFTWFTGTPLKLSHNNNPNLELARGKTFTGRLM